MKLGKQSTLNDLGALQADLEAKIEEAKAIKLGTLSQIQTGMIDGGVTPEVSIYDERPTGVYHLGNVSDAPESITQANNGMMMHMDYSGDDSAGGGIILGWGGHMTIYERYSGNIKSMASVLTNNNTITDANGFIKTA